jgi:transposase-like protein
VGFQVKVRDGQVANWLVYAAIGRTLDGHRDVLQLCIGRDGEARILGPILVDLKTEESVSVSK